MQSHSSANEGKALREAIAIVGIGCRFPGGANSPSRFWELIQNGQDAIVDVPADRWDVRKFYDPDSSKPGKMYTRSGGFLQERIDQFDALFFGVSPREAACMDPQQRLLLEVAWEALEDAGQAPDRLTGSNTGVYIGAFTLDNKLTQMSVSNRMQIGSHTAVGSTMTILSNRLSYFFDFRGPSVSIDTACSSSLVAFHYACQALWNEDCALALAGGVNLMFRPEYTIAMCKGQFLAYDGRCKSFDERADGYGRGEGAGIVVLKPLSNALREGNSIYALVRGTGVNQDGRTNGISVPNPQSQEALIRQVCEQANVSPNQICYFEAHGTGTPVGDPIEASALGAAVGQSRSADTPCVIGSVKANIGHLEAASGVAGLIKAALCLKYQQIPPLANLQNPNPNIPFETLGLRLPRHLEPMPGDGNGLVGVNSFGYGGTNAHAILERSPYVDGTTNDCGDEAKSYLLPISARSQQALKDLAQAYMDRIQDADAPSLRDLCYSASCHRSHHHYRLAAMAQSADGMLTQLQAFVAHGRSDNVSVRTTLEGQDNPIFVFSGMGPQWWAMGRELLQESTEFREAAQACDAIFQRVAGWSILDEMTADESHSRITETQIAQPANFVLQVGMTALLRARGIEPSGIVGHSVGEVTSAYIAGVLDLEDAVRVSYHRSRIQKKVAGLGGMLAVGLSKDAATALLQGYGEQVSIAAVNSLASVTLSGDTEALQDIASKLEQNGVFHRSLHVEVAYHSHYMDPLKDELLASLKGLRPKVPCLPLYSTVTGEVVDEVSYDAAYWYRNIRQPVCFADVIGNLIAQGHRLFLEVGPHPVLSTSIRECLANHGVAGAVVPSLRRHQPEMSRMIQVLGDLYVAGHTVNWDKLYMSGARYVNLPSYPWQRESYWHEPSQSRDDRVKAPEHMLLGNRVTAPGLSWENALNPAYLPYLDDHYVEAVRVLPGATYVEAGLAIHAQTTASASCLLEDLTFYQALLIDDGDEPLVRFVYHERLREYAVYSHQKNNPGNWTLHASGTLSTLQLSPVQPVDLEAIQKRCVVLREPEEHYDRMCHRGLRYGPYFQGVRQLWLNPKEQEILAQIEGHQALGGVENAHRLHPTLLDACFQALLATVNNDDVYIPVRIREIRFYRRPEGRFWCHGQLTARLEDAMEGDLTLFDHVGNVLVQVYGVRVQRLSHSDRSRMNQADKWFYDFQWIQAVPDGPGVAPASWLLFNDQRGLGERLAQQLEAAGAERVIRVLPGDAFHQEAANRFRIRPGDEADLQQLLELSEVRFCQRSAYLWGLDASTHDNDPTGTADAVNMLALVQAFTRQYRSQSPRLFVITRGAQSVVSDKALLALAQSPLVGVMRVALNEYPECQYSLIDLDPAADARDVTSLMGELLSARPEDEVALRGTERYVHRFKRVELGQSETIPPQRAPKQQVRDEPFQVEVGKASVMESVRLRRMQRRAPGPGEVEIEIHAAALHVQDLWTLTGVRPEGALVASSDNHEWGWEASGVVVRVGSEVKHIVVGDAIVAYLSGCLRNFATLRMNDVLIRPKGNRWSDAEWAGLPLHVVTTYYGLHHIASLRRGETVLIHDAASGAGLAAIQVAQAIGARIFATADRPDKLDYLHGLGIERVMASQSTDFVDSILAMTSSLGVDVILNAGNSDVLKSACALLAPFGRFIDLLNRPDAADAILPTRLFKRNNCYAAVDIRRMRVERPERFRQLLSEVQEAVGAGLVSALPTRVFSVDQLAAAFQCITEANTIDQVVIAMRGRIDAPVLPFAHERTLFSSDETHLITGGFGGFGLEIAKWMVEQGARHLVLVGRRGAATPEARQAMEHLKLAGAEVTAVAADVTQEAQVRDLIRNIDQNQPPLKGIWHTAAVFDDAPLSELNSARFEAVMQPKALGAWYLHCHTLDQPLEHFVLFSSVAVHLGSMGQGAYVAANNFLDILAHFRQGQGLPAKSINWGAIGQVGIISRHHDVEQYLERVGNRLFTPREAVQLLARALVESDATQLSIVDVDWRIWGQYHPAWASSDRFAHLMVADERRDGVRGEGAFLSTLMETAPEKRQELLTINLVEQVAATMGLSTDQVDREQSLTNMGMDSLMAMELQAEIQAKLSLTLSTLELMKGLTISQIAENLLLRFTTPDMTTSTSPQTMDGITKTDIASSWQQPDERTHEHDASGLLERLNELSESEIDNLLDTFK